jgi:hypothetical protein
MARRQASLERQQGHGAIVGHRVRGTGLCSTAPQRQRTPRRAGALGVAAEQEVPARSCARCRRARCARGPRRSAADRTAATGARAPGWPGSDATPPSDWSPARRFPSGPGPQPAAPLEAGCRCRSMFLEGDERKNECRRAAREP